MTRGDWTGIADLIERSAADPGLIADVVAEVRSTSREIAALQAGDVARHTRALLAAATRAIAARRAPTRTLGPGRPAAHEEGPGGVVIGIAGPGGAESLPRLRRLAADAARAGSARGRSGAVHVTDVAGIVALFDRPDLADLLVDRHGPALDALGRQAVPTVTAVQAWIECARDAEASAVRLFVHPNTVRNRLAAFTAATGLDLADPLGLVDVWWLCRSWLNLRSDPRAADGPA